MAVREEELRVKIRIDEAGKLQAELAGVNSQFARTKRQAADAASGTDLLQRSVFGLKSVLAGLGLAKLGKEVIEASAGQARAMAQIEQVIRSTGGAAGVTAQEIAGIATELQNVTTVADDSILETQAILLGFRNVSRDVFTDATELALDFAARTGRDAVSAAQFLGKALNEPVKGMRALREAGIALTASQKDQITTLVQQGDLLGAQRIVLDELQRSYGGAARAARQNFGGALQGLANAASDLLEADKGLPAATKAVEDLAAVLADPKTKAAADAFFSAIISGAAAAIQKLIELGGTAKRVRDEAGKPGAGRNAAGNALGVGLATGLPALLAGGPLAGAIGFGIGAGAGALSSLGGKGPLASDPIGSVRGDPEAVSSAIRDTERRIQETSQRTVIAAPGRLEAQLAPQREYLALLEKEEQRLIQIAAQQQDAAAKAVTAAGAVAAAGERAAAAGDSLREETFSARGPVNRRFITNAPPASAGVDLREETTSGQGPAQRRVFANDRGAAAGFIIRRGPTASDAGPVDRTVITNAPNAGPPPTEDFQLEAQKRLDDVSFDAAIAGLTGLDRALAESRANVEKLGDKYNATSDEIEEAARREGDVVREAFQAETFADFTAGIEKANVEIQKLSFVGPTAELDAANAEVEHLADTMQITAEKAAELRDRNRETFDAKQIALTERAINQVGVAIEFNSEQAKVFGNTLEAEHAKAQADVQAYGTAITDLLARGYSATSDEVQGLISKQREAQAGADDLADAIARSAEEAQRAAEETARVEANIQKLIRGTTGRRFEVGADVGALRDQVESLLGEGPSESEQLASFAASLRGQARDLSTRFGSSGNPFQSVLNEQSRQVDELARRVEEEARRARQAEIESTREQQRNSGRPTGVAGGRLTVDLSEADRGILRGVQRATEAEATETRGLRTAISTGTAAAYAANVVGAGVRMGTGRTGWR
jgi:hypothetical protein